MEAQKMNAIKQKIKTFCPVFTGFYNSIWQYQEDNEINEINEERKKSGLVGEITFDNLEIDYRQYEADISEKICEAVKNELGEYIEEINFERVVSPKEYNFVNDSIYCEIIPKIDAIKKFIYNNKKEYIEYLKNKYSSYDGFISAYSNKFETWEEKTNNFNDLGINGHCLGSILEFIAGQLDIDELNIYHDIEKIESEYITNFDKLINCLICDDCGNIIEDEEILKAVAKYKKLMGKYPITNCRKCLENK